MKKAKLTPTTNDQLHAGNGSLQLQPMHPSPMPLQLPAFPLSQPAVEPPKKKGRPKKSVEQISQPAVQSTTEAGPLKIALIGTAPSSRMLAPYNDPSWKIWACSPGNMNVIPRFDAWFEVHGTNLLWPENKSYAPQYIEWMKSLQCPVYMQDQQLVPQAISIPKDNLIDEFGPYFFTSSFSWMMAMAIKAGAKEVALYGIDMASRDEYIIQRPGAYWFFCEGARRGCKVWAPYESDIMQPPGLYGYSDVTPYGRKLNARKAEINERVVSMRQQRDSLIHNITYLEGALEDNDYNLSIQGGVQDNSSLSYLESLLQKSKANPDTKAVSATLSQG